MSLLPPVVGPNVRSLFALFPSSGDLPEFDYVPADEVPSPYDSLLVHEHHMTVTVENFHGGPVDVRILARAYSRHHYARKILLLLQRDGRVVQFGIVRVNLDYCSPPVRAEILAGKKPFGRILIEHNVLRRIEPTAFVNIRPGPATSGWFGLSEPHSTYGRLAYIHCDNFPAVELLEIVAPVAPI